MPISDIMTAITGGLTGALTGMATGIGNGIKAMITALAFETVNDVTQLSVLFNMVITFAGISLAIGLGRKIWGFITSLGRKK